MSQMGFISKLFESLSVGISHSSSSGNTSSHDISSTSACTSCKRDRRRFSSNSQVFYFISIVLLSFCISGGLASPDSSNASPLSSNNEIQKKIRDFLQSHCNRQNETLEQREFEDFISCSPTHAASTFQSLEAYKDVDPSLRHKEIQKEINKQCSAWPQEKTCQKKNFKLIQKCFDGQQKFVFYFMLALTDTICQEGDLFIGFWEKGGDQCLKDHLQRLTQDISQCFSFTSTMTKQELDRNINRITSCIGDKFQNCGSPESNQVIGNLLQDIETFYNETSSSNSLLLLSANKSYYILISLSLFIVITQRVLLS